MESVGTSYSSLIGNVIPEGTEEKMTCVRQDQSPSNPIRSGKREFCGAPHSDFSETTVGSFVNLSTEGGGSLIIERFTVKRRWAYQRKKILNITPRNQLLKGLFLQIQFVTAH